MFSILGLPQLPISYATIGAIVILLLGLILGCCKGLLKSIFSILSTIGSIVAAMFAMPYASNFLLQQEFIKNMGEIGGKLVAVLSFVISWILAYLILKLIFAIINRIVPSDGVLGKLNRFLGGIFGLASAFLVTIVIAYLIGIFQNVGFFQSIVENSSTDPVGAWLFSNNLLEKILAWLGEKVPAIKQFLDSISGMLPQQTPKA